jgi:predicted CXXCH cytochrome family protein
VRLAVSIGDSSLGRPEDFMFFVPTSRKAAGRFLAIGVILIGIALVGIANAAERENESCIGCHTVRGLSLRFPSGDMLPLTIDAVVMHSSVHGSLNCTKCHTGIQKFPHPKNTANDRREFQMQRNEQCQACHEKEFKQELNSNHARVLAAGNQNGAICIDCHGSHSVTKPNVPRSRISTACGQCHRAIYEQYLNSVHGKALLETSNPDVPVCSDCHRAHNQEDPTTQAFRLKSPNLCATCHANAKMMRKYNITPDVFNTYVSDFHGMTVTLFQKESPDQPTNKAVCIDCHGIHDIQDVTAATSTVIKQNLLTTCRKCHPDATTNFPDSWIGHFPPTRDRFPLVYYVNLFYMILIPTTIGAMLLFAFVDAGGRIIRRFRRNPSQAKKES